MSSKYCKYQFGGSVELLRSLTWLTVLWTVVDLNFWYLFSMESNRLEEKQKFGFISTKKPSLFHHYLVLFSGPKLSAVNSVSKATNAHFSALSAILGSRESNDSAVTSHILPAWRRRKELASHWHKLLQFR